MVLFGNLHTIEVYSNGYEVVAEKVQLYAKSGCLANDLFIFIFFGCQSTKHFDGI